jgi:hypothetical protein
LKKEERGLLDAVRERAEQREEQEKKRKEREPRKPYRLPQGQVVSSLTLSPDENFVIATLTDQPRDVKNTIVPNYVTESAYTEDIPGRSKVGDTQARSRLMLIDAQTGEAKRVDHGLTTGLPLGNSKTEKTETAKTNQEVSETAQEQSTTQNDRGDEDQTQRTASQRATRSNERDVQLSQPVWSDDGKKAVMLARSADNKDRWIMLLDPATGKTKTLATIHDDAWVGGPGSNLIGWLPDNAHVYFESERDGWAHLFQ